MVRMEYHEALPCSTDFTAYCDPSACFLELALPVVAQPGSSMTPAIARATELKFRVRFIVFCLGVHPAAGRFGCDARAPVHKSLLMRRQEKPTQAG